MSQNKEPSKTLIYVSNLPFDTTDEQFRDLFKGFTVKTAYVAKRKNGRSKGFGFVNLEKESDQNAAIEKLNGFELSSRKLIARIAYNDDRRNENGELKEEFRTATTNTQQPPSETVVYVSNLAWTVNDEELRKIFAEFNPKTVTVATRKNGRSKGFGFVEFNSKEDREKALSLDQKTFSERQIGVKPSTGFRGDKPRDTNRNNNNNRRSKSPRRNNNNRDNNNRRNNNNNRRSKSPSKRTPSGNTTSSNNSRPERKTSEFTIYIKNLPFELDETDLKDVFGEFHPTAANIPKRDGRSKGFGFVEFGNAKDRDDSLRALDQSEINGRVVSISVSRGGASSNNNNRDNNRDNNRRNRSPRRNRDNNNRSGSKNRPRSEKKSTATGEQSKTNVYVSNIPFSINEKRLEEVFTGLKINNCTIPRKRNGNSFGYAFIEFASTEDQQKALKLNETEVEGRKLTIQAAHQRTESK